MVMDAPSPQSVGREFVRQYYTLLNKAPDHLHRFYNNSSSFVHGGLEPQNREATLVVGQKNIHNKIQQLNFRDCHAKISQVDSQSTLGNGVVVQVTGELSNDGQPMRRFTQTFVLAAQAPKKYYVHNDIFRYQDLYTDEENDGENRSENDEDQDGENVVENIQPISHQQPIYYPTGPTIQGYPQQQPPPQLQPPESLAGFGCEKHKGTNISALFFLNFLSCQHFGAVYNAFEYFAPKTVPFEFLAHFFQNRFASNFVLNSQTLYRATSVPLKASFNFYRYFD